MRFCHLETLLLMELVHHKRRAATSPVASSSKTLTPDMEREVPWPKTLTFTTQTTQTRWCRKKFPSWSRGPHLEPSNCGQKKVPVGVHRWIKINNWKNETTSCSVRHHCQVSSPWNRPDQTSIKNYGKTTISLTVDMWTHSHASVSPLDWGDFWFWTPDCYRVALKCDRQLFVLCRFEFMDWVLLQWSSFNTDFVRLLWCIRDEVQYWFLWRQNNRLTNCL